MASDSYSNAQSYKTEHVITAWNDLRTINLLAALDSDNGLALLLTTTST
jgi:hypothetical protein